MKKIQEKIQKQTQKILSTYTADVSGVCSALFELGGMTVMHDASGCNSTYNTHDEPRWYDSDSLVFLSGLTEMEAILGDDQRLSADIVAAARELQPRFIAIAGSPIPALTGCDLPAIAASIEAETGICTFGFATTGMQSYVTGAGMALAAVARRLTKPVSRAKTPTVNLLGATPLDFPLHGAIPDMIAWLQEAGYRVQSTWAMGSTLEELCGAGAAWVNLVISSTGLPAAQALQEKFGTPYVVGTPAGQAFGRVLLEHLACSAHTGRSSVAFADCEPDGAGVILGEAVTARSLAAAIGLERGAAPQVLCPLEAPPGLLSGGDAAMRAECDLEQRLRTAAWVAADPLYRPIVPAQTPFYSLPHPAFSGRLWRGQMVNLVKHL